MTTHRGWNVPCVHSPGASGSAGHRRTGRDRPAGWCLFLLIAATLSACHRTSDQDRAGDNTTTSADATSVRFPAGAEGLKLLSDFNRGSALMEQYEYAKAAEVFERVVEAVPPWVAARVNLGLAYLNLAGESDARAFLERAIKQFDQVLQAEPENAHALFSLGMAYDYLGEMEKAQHYFEKVYGLDPNDLFAGHKYAESLKRAGSVEQAIPILEKVVERDPGFVSSVYLLATMYRTTHREKALQLFERFKQLSAAELNSGAFVVKTAYGMAGKYYDVVGPDGFPLSQTVQAAARIQFSPELSTWDTTSTPWSWPGGTIDLPGLATADVDQDGDLDVLLAARTADGGAALWINDGRGKFQAGDVLAAGVVAPCPGDVDNDGDVDFWLGANGPDRLLVNDGNGQFHIETPADIAGPDQLTPVTRLIDLDSDGDLDLLAYRWQSGDLPGGGEIAGDSGSVWSNNTDGTFTDTAAALGLSFPDVAAASVVCDDVDGDRDLDVLVFPCRGEPTCWVNFRLGQFDARKADRTGLQVTGTVSAATGDVDKDGDRDLLVFTPDGIQLFLNQGSCRFEADQTFGDGLGRCGGTGGQFVDMDNDGDLDILIADGHRLGGQRGPSLLVNQWPDRRFVPLDELDAGNLLGSIQFPGNASAVAADFTGNGNCDILLAPSGAAPLLVENITTGGHWIALDLAGKRPRDQKARSANSALGARVEIKTGGVFQQYLIGGNSGPVAAAPLRVHAGLGPNTKVDWVRVVWPDSVLQGEVEMAADRVAAIEQMNRKTSSCPMLFAWDGRQYTFVADFGGVGGLGYLAAPGSYARPDPTEYLRIPRLEPRDGQYVLQVVTQLEEITYLDELKLIAVDHPAGTEVYPNEMMAISAPPPEFEVYCVEKPLFPVRALDHRGRDVTLEVQQVDRRYAGATDLDGRFIGVAQPHAVELDFGNQLAGLAAGSRLVLFLDGWVEYGYSSTNYAASQAGVTLRAPTIEVQRDGQWHVLLSEVGYPAGINHQMTLDLTGKLLPTDRQLRISSNMELYWDQVFLAAPSPAATITMRESAPLVADLHAFGYPREYSPDGHHPNLYDYANSDPSVGWKLMSGRYTRFGDVRPLLAAADDQFAIMCHGEEVTLRFATDQFGPVPAGCRRTLVLKTDSYCKDMDLYTAYPDTVEPLPFHGMSGYPYGADEQYPDTAETRAYRAQYNTRVIRGQ